jgi:hypothetical protein
MFMMYSWKVGFCDDLLDIRPSPLNSARLPFAIWVAVLPTVVTRQFLGTAFTNYVEESGAFLSKPSTSEEQGVA